MQDANINVMRIVEVLVAGTWNTIEFKNLKAGDRFRMFEDEQRTKLVNNGQEFIASSNAFIDDKHSNMGFDCYGINIVT